VDIEAAGGAVTGGLIAKAVERPTGEAGDETRLCSDCGEPVSGKFCANCGQPTHVHRTLLHLVEEVLHGVMHFDARVWRTLPLLAFNPGRLTREWIQGKRTRYISPLAMFLFTVFVMFFIMSFGGGSVVNVNQRPLDEQIIEARQAVTETQALIASAERQAAAGVPGSSVSLDAYRGGLVGVESRLQRLEAAKAGGPRPDGLQAGSWQAEIADAVNDDRVSVGVGDKKMQTKILQKLSNPDFALYKVQQTLYKFAFLLVPLSIPFVWLLFLWKRGFTWYDHGVFVLYSLTFMALLGLGTMAAGAIGGTAGGWRAAVGGTLGVIFMLWVPVHMFAQLKGTYGLRIFSALWRTFALLIFCTVVLTLFILAIVLLGLGA
jgi:hypothetical protein